MAGAVIGRLLIGPTNAPELYAQARFPRMVMDGMVMGPTELEAVESRPAAEWSVCRRSRSSLVVASPEEARCYGARS